MRLDKVMAFLMLIAASSLFIVSILNQGKGMGITIVLLVSSLIYLKFERAIIDRQEPSHKPVIQKLLYIHIPVLITALIGIFLICSLIFPLRGFWFFVSSSILASIVTFEILFLRRFSRFITANILLQIILIATILRWSLIFESSTFVEKDQWYHTHIVEDTVNRGHLNYVSPSYDSYGFVERYRIFPVYHILVSIFKILTGIRSMKYAITYSIGLSDLVGLAVLFLLYRQILGRSRTAFLATLLTASASWNIAYGAWLVPQSLGLMFFSIMLYLCFSRIKYRVLLTSVFSFLLILSHPLSSFLWMMLAIALVLGGFVHQELYKKFHKPVLLSEALMTFSVALISYWIFANNVFVEYTKALYRDLTASRGILGLSPPIKSIEIYELDNIGLNLFFLLAAVGFLAWLHRKNADSVRFSVLAGSATLFSIIYGSLFFGIAYGSSFSSERWYCFIFRLMAMPAAYFLNKLSRARSRFVGGALTILVVSTFVFTMSGSSIASFDNPLVGSRYMTNPTFSSSEMLVADLVNASFVGVIQTDNVFLWYFEWQLKRDVKMVEFIRPNDVYSNASRSNVAMVIRDYIYKRPVAAEGEFGRSRITTIVDRSFEEELNNRANVIISSGTTTVYKGFMSNLTNPD